MKTSSKMLFFTILVVSTMMVLSSSTWMSMWIGLEINLMSFIPLMFTYKNKLVSQSTMMYFLTQSMSSMLFLMLMLNNKYIFYYMENNMMKYMMFMTMMMKMGMPPFHMWMPEMLSKTSWNMCFILMTWQKMAPMFISSLIIQSNYMFIFMISISAMVGAVGGINQTSTRKIMAYSSMSHMGWMMSCAMTFKKSWMMYLFLYAMLMLMMSIMMYNYNILYINQMNIFSTNNMEKITIISLMLSMAGLPPFLGFLPKWISIQYMIQTNEFIMMSVLMMSALITLSYYLKLSSSMNLMMSYSQKWMYIYESKKKMMIIMFWVNISLPLMVLLFNFY